MRAVLSLFAQKGMVSMIKIRIRNAGHEVDVRFPISESKLYAKLSGIHAVENRNDAQSAYVTEVYWPEELSMLKDRFSMVQKNPLIGEISGFFLITISVWWKRQMGIKVLFAIFSEIYSRKM